MYYIHLSENIITEIVSDENPLFPGITVAQRYSPNFINQCIIVSDASTVHMGMVYDPETKTFSEAPTPVTPDPTPEDPTLAAKQAEVNRLIDGGTFALPDELHRQSTLASTANDSLTALYDYLAQCFPDQFGT